MGAPVLALPSFEGPIPLFVSMDRGMALGVLTQEYGGSCQLVACFSSLPDPVSRGWSKCIQTVAATALLTEENRKLTFGGRLT